MAKLAKDIVIVTNSELGWDSIVGVFSSHKEALDTLNLEQGQGKHDKSYWEERCYVFNEWVVTF